MHVSLMCCNPYMCACPVQCVSNTRLKSKQIGISFSPKDMGGTKGRTWMKGLDNGRPVQIDSQEACTKASSMPKTTTIVRTLQRWWLGQSCVPSMEQRQWLHIVLCRECVCVWVIMLCVSIWSLCVCVSEMHQAVQNCYDANELAIKKEGGKTYYGFPPTWRYVGP